MKNYIVLYYDINTNCESSTTACGKNAAEVQSIFSRVYPERKIISMKVQKVT